MSTDMLDQPLPRESNRARQAFEDYFALGPGRSLADLMSAYRVQIESKTSPPARRLATLKAWSADFGWQDRVAEREQAASARALAAFEAERQSVLSSGYALLHKRLESLNRLAIRLIEELERPPALGTPAEGERPATVGDPGGLWVHDVKQIGAGEGAREVDVWRPNGTFLEQFRGTLDDIAVELGGRVKGVEVVGKGGGPVQVSVIEVIAPGSEGLDAVAAAGAAAAAAGAAGVDGSP